MQLEYDNIEGMILLSELSRRRIRSVQKLIRVGRNEVVVVMRVDPDKGESSSSLCVTLSRRFFNQNPADLALNLLHLSHDIGYIDLSKRRVSAEEVIKCEEQYEKGKAVDSIITQVAKKCDVETERLYESVVWPLGKKYGHAHDAFKMAVT